MTSAADAAYKVIRDAIFAGELVVGDSLAERDLAERTGLSRTPIREAITRLRHDGLVVLERNSRNYVAHFDEEDVTEILEIRALLEGRLAGRAASHIEKQDLRRLKGLAKRMEALVASKGADAEQAYVPLNREFHEIIFESGQSQRAEKILHSFLATPFNMLGRFRGHMNESLARACEFHRQIIHALEDGDAERANSQMSAHILSLKKVPDRA